MATTFTFYNDGKKDILNNAIDLINDTLKISLHTSTYSPDIDADSAYSDLSNELAASGNYTTGGETVAGNTIAADDTNDRAYFDCTDQTWTALTPSSPFRYGVLRSSTGNELIGYFDFGANQDPGGSNFVIQMTAPGSGGVFYI